VGLSVGNMTVRALEEMKGSGRYGAVQCSAVQYSRVQCNAVHSSTVQCSAGQCSAVQCSAVQCSAQQSSTVQCRAVQQSSALYCTTRYLLVHLVELVDKTDSLISQHLRSMGVGRRLRGRDGTRWRDGWYGEEREGVSKVE
jgi:hypothetical protein